MKIKIVKEDACPKCGNEFHIFHLDATHVDETKIFVISCGSCGYVWREIHDIVFAGVDIKEGKDWKFHPVPVGEPEKPKKYGYRVLLGDGKYLKCEWEKGNWTDYGNVHEAKKKARMFNGTVERFDLPAKPKNGKKPYKISLTGEGITEITMDLTEAEARLIGRIANELEIIRGFGERFEIEEVILS